MVGEFIKSAFIRVEGLCAIKELGAPRHFANNIEVWTGPHTARGMKVHSSAKAFALTPQQAGEKLA
jgi:hypothetical protein